MFSIYAAFKEIHHMLSIHEVGHDIHAPMRSILSTAGFELDLERAANH